MHFVAMVMSKFGAEKSIKRIKLKIHQNLNSGNVVTGLTFEAYFLNLAKTAVYTADYTYCRCLYYMCIEATVQFSLFLKVSIKTWTSNLLLTAEPAIYYSFRR